MLGLTKDEIKSCLYDLGVSKGDNLFIISDLSKIGYLSGTREDTINDWLKILEELVGNDGGIIAPAYTKGFFRFKKKKIVFNKKLKSHCGSLSNALINNKNSCRSSHPLMSVVGIGRSIEKIVLKHSYNSLSYSYIEEFMDLKQSKFLMLGTYDSVHFPQSFHYAQEKLGITTKNIMKGFFQIYYKDENNSLKLFTRNDYGGCSKGAVKLYQEFKENDIIRIKKIGFSLSALVDARKSYNLILNALLQNPKFYLCNDEDCFDCYGNPYLSLKSSLFYYLKNTKKLLKKLYESYYKS